VDRSRDHRRLKISNIRHFCVVVCRYITVVYADHDEIFHGRGRHEPALTRHIWPRSGMSVVTVAPKDENFV